MARTILRRPAFPEALVWMEIYGDAPEIVAEWKNARETAAEGEEHGAPSDAARDDDPRHDGSRRRRRRRRRRRGPRTPGSGTAD
jgi:hypothetical protein